MTLLTVHSFVCSVKAILIYLFLFYVDACHLVSGDQRYSRNESCALKSSHILWGQDHLDDIITDT